MRLKDLTALNQQELNLLETIEILDSMDFLERDSQVFPAWNYGMFQIRLKKYRAVVYNRFYDGSGVITKIPFEKLLDSMSPQHQERMLFHLDLFV